MLARRIACAMALLAFALALLVGGVQAGNSFGTTVTRALAAMAGTFVIGLVVGVMATRMLADNVEAEEKKFQELQAETTANDR